MQRQRETTPTEEPAVHLLDTSSVKCYFKDTSQHLGHVVAAVLYGWSGPLQPDEANLGWCCPDVPPEWQDAFQCLAMQVMQQDNCRERAAGKNAEVEGPEFYLIRDSGRVLEILMLLEEVTFNHHAKFHVFPNVPRRIVGLKDDEVLQWRDEQRKGSPEFANFVVPYFRTPERGTEITPEVAPVLAQRGTVLLLLPSRRPDAVQILVVNSQYKDKDDAQSYGFPGGRVKWGSDKSPAETAIREFNKKVNPGSHPGWFFKEAVYGDYVEVTVAPADGAQEPATTYVIAMANADFQRRLDKSRSHLLLPTTGYVSQLKPFPTRGNTEAFWRHWTDPTSVFLEHDTWSLYTFDLLQRASIQISNEGNLRDLQDPSAAMKSVSYLLSECYEKAAVHQRLHVILHQLGDVDEVSAAAAPYANHAAVPTETRGDTAPKTCRLV